MSDCSTHAFDTALKECPFCKRIDSVELYHIEGTSWVVEGYKVLCAWDKGGCGAQGGYSTTRAGAISNWNDRAEDTCRNIYQETCDRMHECDNGFKCSRCGNLIEDYEYYRVKGTWNYCSACRAKVVG